MQTAAAGCEPVSGAGAPGPVSSHSGVCLGKPGGLLSKGHVRGRRREAGRRAGETPSGTSVTRHPVAVIGGVRLHEGPVSRQGPRALLERTE